ncbi:MAG: BamA/TamA family outer membrane protein [Deltaproteobacteria bacterium]|nr:BamA/TamA family outer membrane protein [Deltaproteobacteria bacterium]
MTSLRRIALCSAMLVARPALADDEPPTTPDEPRRPTGEFSVGVGFNPDDGVIAGASVRQPRLFGTHHRLALSADISALRQRVGLVYDAPDLLGTGLDLTTELFSNRVAYPTFARAGTGGQATLGHKLDRATTLFVRYRVEAVNVDGPEALARGESAPPPGGAAMYTWLGVGLRYDTRDQPLATRGTYLEALGESSDPRLGSDAKLMRLSARLAHATPLGPFTLRLGGRASYVTGPGGVPFSERLQYDGHAEVRGYGIGSLGDGGANLAASARAELEVPLIPRLGLSVAGFFDAGVRYNADATWGPVGWRTVRSAGASIIWRSPIGPLRFDWARTLDGDRRDRVFLFGLGTGF